MSIFQYTAAKAIKLVNESIIDRRRMAEEDKMECGEGPSIEFMGLMSLGHVYAQGSVHVAHK